MKPMLFEDNFSLIIGYRPRSRLSQWFAHLRVLSEKTAVYSIYNVTWYEMKKLILISVILLAALYFGFAQNKSVSIHNIVETIHSSDNIIESAFKNRSNNFQVEGQGVVIKIIA